MSSPASISQPELILPQTFSMTAQIVGNWIALRRYHRPDRLASFPLVYPVRDEVYAIVFRYGAVVIVNGNESDFTSVQQEFFSLIDTPIQAGTLGEGEAISITIDSNKQADEVDGDTVTLATLTIPRAQLIGEMLARSVLLSHYESKIRFAFHEVEPLAQSLQAEGTIHVPSRKLLKQIGTSLLSEHHLVGRVEVSEKPDLLWESPELDRLYYQLEDELEIEERAGAVKQKVNLIQRTAGTILDLLHTKRGLHLEWAIVLLIVVEILFTVSEHL